MPQYKKVTKIPRFVENLRNNVSEMRGDVSVFPPTAEEILAIVNHALFVTDSKTVRTKRFKEWMEVFFREWDAYIRERGSELRYNGWNIALQNVANITCLECGYVKKGSMFATL